MRKIVFLALMICASMTSCEKGDYGSPNYNNSAGPNNNNNNNRPVNNNNPTINPPPADTSWYYRFPVNTWVRIKNFYLHDDFVFKMKEDTSAGVYAMKPKHTSDVLRFPYKIKRITAQDRTSIPTDEFYSGNFIVEICNNGNGTAKLRYRCVNPGSIDHMGLPYVTTGQLIEFSLIYKGKNTNFLPLYSMSYSSGSRLNITYEPQSVTIQRYLDLSQWTGGYTLYEEEDGSFSFAQLGNNTPAIFCAPV